MFLHTFSVAILEMPRFYWGCLTSTTEFHRSVPVPNRNCIASHGTEIERTTTHSFQANSVAAKSQRKPPGSLVRTTYLPAAETRTITPQFQPLPQAHAESGNGSVCCSGAVPSADPPLRR